MQNEESFLFRVLERPLAEYLCESYLHRCDSLLTVSPGLAQAYQEEYNVEMEVIFSAPIFHDLPIRTQRDGLIRMVHHGNANRNRGLENMIEITRRLGREYTLDLYLVGSKKQIQYLKRCADGCSRVRILAPVKLSDIVPMLNGYDVGLYYLEPNGFNVTYNLPNKLFEFVQARLAIAIGPSPNMSELVSAYDCGFVAKTFTLHSMVSTLSALDREAILSAKRGSDAAAKELCFENEGRKIVSIIEKMLN
ncbi:MAG: hypothetical protein V7696_19235 [Halioglobus sp.]